MTRAALARSTLAPLSPAIGAELLGVDAGSADCRTMRSIHDALAAYRVLVLRDQRLEPATLAAFARRFGDIDVNRFLPPAAGHPAVAEVRTEPGHARNIGARWHTDQSYDAVPAAITLMYAHEAPALGGDTLYACTRRAFESLSARLKGLLVRLRAVHSSHRVFADADRDPEMRRRFRNTSATEARVAVHPVVVGDPGSGRGALFVNPEFTVAFDGWTPEESAPLLDHLYEVATDPRTTCRIRWRSGTLVIADNRSTMHRNLNDYQGSRCVMHRVTVAGAPLTGRRPDHETPP